MADARYLLARRTAQHLIGDFGITSPDEIKLELIAVDRGVFPQEIDFPGADARLVTSKDRKSGIASINATIPEHGRKRFALAHELGHFELHRHHTPDWNCTEYDFLRFGGTQVQEIEANVFAAELLMPEKLFRKDCIGMTPGFQSIAKLAKIFNTSISSTVYKYVEFGNHPCALLCCKENRVAWFKLSLDFHHRVLPVGNALHQNTAVWEFFNSGKRPPEEERTLPVYWLQAGTFDSRTELYVHCLAMPRYDTIMVLLWEP